MQPTSRSLLLVASLAACGGKAKEPDTHASAPMAMQMGMAPPSAASQALLAKTATYATWPRFAENAEPKPSKGHMGSYVVTYHNDVVTAAIAAHTLPLPDGPVIVKQNKPAADAAPKNLTIMSKQGGRWYWLNATPDGKVITMNDMPLEGFDTQMCTKCHDDASTNDFVFVHDFAK